MLSCDTVQKKKKVNSELNSNNKSKQQRGTHN